MPLPWKRIVWFASFAIAVILVLWMRNLGYGWFATLGFAVLIWVVSPFVVSQLRAAFLLRRMHGRMHQADGPADKIAGAAKGLAREQ